MNEVDEQGELVRVRQELEALVQRRLLEGLTRQDEVYYKALLALESRLLAQRGDGAATR